MPKIDLKEKLDKDTINKMITTKFKALMRIEKLEMETFYLNNKV